MISPPATFTDSTKFYVKFLILTVFRFPSRNAMCPKLISANNNVEYAFFSLRKSSSNFILARCGLNHTSGEWSSL